MRTDACGYPSWPGAQLHKQAGYIFADYPSTSFALAATRRIIHFWVTHSNKKKKDIYKEKENPSANNGRRVERRTMPRSMRGSTKSRAFKSNCFRMGKTEKALDGWLFAACNSDVLAGWSISSNQERPRICSQNWSDDLLKPIENLWLLSDLE